MLSNLGACLLLRFGRAEEAETLNEATADLDEAIQVGRRAVDATPPGHSAEAMCLSNLGNTLLTRFKRIRDDADLDEAIGCWRRASALETGTPSVRLYAARGRGVAAADAGLRGEAAEAYGVAVGLLSVVAWHGLNRITLEEQLAAWAGLASDAAACAVLNDQSDLAVELLEQGRSVLWGEALNLRLDLTSLGNTVPELAERLEEIRDVLDTPIPNTSQAQLGPGKLSAGPPA